jgi:hypothetical protein
MKQGLPYPGTHEGDGKPSPYSLQLPWRPRVEYTA